MAAKDVPAEWYAPNQQALGLPGPARTTVVASEGDGTVTETAPRQGGEDAYDSTADTIPGVKQYVEDHPDQRAAVLKAEKARGDQARTTLVDWLSED